MYYSSKAYFLDQVGNVGANWEFFGRQTTLFENLQKKFFEPSSETKMTPKMRATTKFANSLLYPLPLLENLT